jgi:polyisoprenoid-binding protein YceI
MGKLKLLVGAVVALAVLVSAGTYVYIHYIDGDPPARLTLSPQSQGTNGEVTGTWRPTAASQVGYRVKEVLFGQHQEAVGRTNKVSGTMTIDGTTVTAVDLTVDLASVTSGESRRDNQFRGRIMDTSSFPTATFKLTVPLTLPATDQVSVDATGDLTIRGRTRAVTIPLKARRTGATVEVQGSLPITFADWGIPNPSFGPASTEDHGELELLVVFERAA